MRVELRSCFIQTVSLKLGLEHHKFLFQLLYIKEGRFKWRHDSILQHFTKASKAANTKKLLIYADLPGMSINGGTILVDIVATSLRPDIVIVNKQEKFIELMELTCSFEKNIDAANLRKYTNYLDLKSDIEAAGWKTSLVPFEVGSRGQITQRNKKSIIDSCKRNQLKIKHNQIMKEMSKISLLCSFAIYQAHCQPAWQDPPLLSP